MWMNHSKCLMYKNLLNDLMTVERKHGKRKRYVEGKESIVGMLPVKCLWDTQVENRYYLS